MKVHVFFNFYQQVCFLSIVNSICKSASTTRLISKTFSLQYLGQKSSKLFQNLAFKACFLDSSLPFLVLAIILISGLYFTINNYVFDHKQFPSVNHNVCKVLYTVFFAECVKMTRGWDVCIFSAPLSYRCLCFDLLVLDWLPLQRRKSIRIKDWPRRPFISNRQSYLETEYVHLFKDGERTNFIELPRVY